MPEDAYYKLGHDQQIRAIVPSRDLVIVRLGLSREGECLEPCARPCAYRTRGAAQPVRTRGSTGPAKREFVSASGRKEHMSPSS